MTKKIPSLDGLRSVSIALVVIGHLANGYGIDHSPLRTIFGNASLGVNVFFVISGFLITTLLLREWSLSGRIGLKDFYIRRAFRILPPYYFYLAVVFLLGLISILLVPSSAMLSSSLFLWNYWPVGDAWYFDHLWSLAVEEQFYLLWPLSLIWALHRGNRRMAITIAVAVIILSPLMRVGTYLLGPEAWRTHLYYMFHTRADSLMFGSLVALTINSRIFEKVYLATSRYVWLAVFFTMVLSPLLTQSMGGAYLYVIGYTMEGVSIALTMVWLVRNPRSAVGKLLNSGPVVHIGVMSYSIYLWQTLFLDASNTSFSAIFPVSILCIAIFSTISYYLVEKPMLRVRSSFLNQEMLEVQSER